MAMNFRKRVAREEPEINLIPFIDVLLVVLIFLMLSTTYSKFTEMQLRLPTADADPLKERPKEIIVSVAADGRYGIDREALPDRSVGALSERLASLGRERPGAIVIVSADASAAHQSVIAVLEAARRAGLHQITFAAQSSGAQAR